MHPKNILFDFENKIIADPGYLTDFLAVTKTLLATSLDIYAASTA